MLATFGGIATAILALALIARLPGGVLVCVLLLGGEYAGSLFARGVALDRRAPLYAAALLALAESAFLALDRRTAPGAGPGRVGAAALLVLAGAGVAALVLFAATPGAHGGLALGAAGAVGAVAALAIVAWLARRAAGARRSTRPGSSPGC